MSAQHVEAVAVRPPPGSGGVFKCAAVEVLKTDRRLMTTTEVTRRALELGLLGSLPGKTPAATMASALYTDLKKGKGKGGATFARPTEGLFGLRAWAEDPQLAHLLEEPVHPLAPPRASPPREPSKRARTAPGLRNRPHTPPRPAHEAESQRPKRARQESPTKSGERDYEGIDFILEAARQLLTPIRPRQGAKAALFAPARSFYLAPEPEPLLATAAGFMLNQPATEALPRSPSTPAEGAMHTTPTDTPMDVLASEERLHPADAHFSVADVVAEFSPMVRPDMMPLALWSYARTCASQGWAGRAAAVAEHAFQLHYASRPPGLSVEAAKAEFQAFAGRTAAQVGL